MNMKNLKTILVGNKNVKLKILINYSDIVSAWNDSIIKLTHWYNN